MERACRPPDDGGLPGLLDGEVLGTAVHRVGIVGKPGHLMLGLTPRQGVGQHVVVDLADAHGLVAVSSEILREGDRLGRGHPEIGLEVPDPEGIGAEPGHQAGPRGIADRLLHLRVEEYHARTREAVDVGRLDDRVPVRTEGGAEVVHRDEEDVWSLRLGGRCTWCGAGDGPERGQECQSGRSAEESVLSPRPRACPDDGDAPAESRGDMGQREHRYSWGGGSRSLPEGQSAGKVAVRRTGLRATTGAAFCDDFMKLGLWCNVLQLQELNDLIWGLARHGTPEYLCAIDCQLPRRKS